MITFRNITTGQEINVGNVKKVADGRIFFSVRNAGCGSRFLTRNICLTLNEQVENGTYLNIAEGWEIVKGAKNTPKAKPTEEKPQPQAEATTTATETATETEQPQPQPKAEAEATKVEDDALELAKLLQRLKGGNVTIDANQVRSIIAEELAKLASEDVKKISKLAKKTASAKEHHCADFDEICDYVSDGQPVYLYGAAGCGKSHTAEQVANALGLDFYTQSQVLFAHDVKGYGDANGNFQETPFFKAFTKGGLFFIDEMDASAPEALVVLNTAIANRMYDFPVVGNVKAHENFRIIAAGNTALTGADTEYTARAVQDASTINRFAFFEMSYNKAIELPIMAKGDEVLYNYICDLRNAIKETRISLCVSYRQTATLATEKAIKYGREKALMRNVFGGREVDEIRILHEALADKSNVWAKAMKSLIK